MNSIEEMFGLKDEENKTISIQKLNIKSIHPYPNQPFKLYKDKALNDLAEDIKINGLIHPIIVRPLERGQFQMISGHNRLEACKQIGWTEIDAVIKELDDNEAQLMLVQANLVQRHHFSNKEKAFAYKMRHDSLKRQGVKGETPYSSLDEMSHTSLDSPRQIARYIKTTKLIPQWMQEFDDKEIPLPCAEIIAGLDQENQYRLYLYTQENGVKINTKIAKEISRGIKEGQMLTDALMVDIFSSLTTKTEKRTLEEIFQNYLHENNDLTNPDKQIIKHFLTYLMEKRINLKEIIV